MILSWCMAAGHRPAGLNPAKWEKHFDQILPAPQKIAKTKRFAALPYMQLPAFMKRLRACEGLAARALELTILTAARSGEVFGATWDEIDFDNATWTIPASRMKAGKEHRVPLSPAALALLEALPREDNNPFVFIGAKAGRGLDKNAMTSVLAHLGCSGITVHGFRSCFSDWAHEQTAHANHTIEISLAHAVGSETEKAYRRGPMLAKRVRLMSDWAKYCCSPPVQVSDNVVALR
jgi:integrase